MTKIKYSSTVHYNDLEKKFKGKPDSVVKNVREKYESEKRKTEEKLNELELRISFCVAELLTRHNDWADEHDEEDLEKEFYTEEID